MDRLLVIAAYNSAAALVLALFVAALTRVWRRPPVTHVLWLLVLVKLVTPPLLPFEFSVGQLGNQNPAAGQLADDSAHFEDQATGRADQVAPSIPVSTPGLAARMRQAGANAQPVLFWCWLGGAALCGLLAATRIMRFERMLTGTLAAPERLQRITRDLAGKLDVRTPRVCLAEAVQVPLLWCATGRPTIVLPLKLLRELDDQQAALVVAHELAHLRRRDPWVRYFELAMSTIYWWNPLVWFVRRQLHEAEDLCCDAWVRWMFPASTKQYAEVLLQAAESLDAAPPSTRLLPASPLLHSLSLKARIEMILQNRFAPSVSRKSWFAIGLFACVVLPLFVSMTNSQVRADSNAKPAATPGAPTAALPASQFPHVVHFEQGATRFADGDNITILEVRGTADTFTPGHLYWIKGTYKLGSRDRATLAAYTTAAERADGTSRTMTVQSTKVDKGEGTFTLYLPMTCRGWPHVSFYPADNGEGFGGNYFGTGDSVLKRWWSVSNKADATARAPARIGYSRY